MRARAGRALAAAALASALGTAAARAQTLDVTGTGYDRGSANAPVFIVEFGDFGCSACAKFHRDTFAALNQEFIATGKVRWKFVPFVMGSFPNSGAAARAAICAGDQDAFWSMHDLLYDRQPEWNKLSNPRAQMETFARQLNLDPAKFHACYTKDSPRERVGHNNQLANTLQVRATPTFFVNGRRAVGALPIDMWRRIVAQVAAGG